MAGIEIIRPVLANSSDPALRAALQVAHAAAGNLDRCLASIIPGNESDPRKENAGTRELADEVVLD